MQEEQGKSRRNRGGATYLESSSGFHCASGLHPPLSFSWPGQQDGTQKTHSVSSLTQTIRVTHWLQAENNIINSKRSWGTSITMAPSTATNETFRGSLVSSHAEIALPTLSADFRGCLLLLVLGGVSMCPDSSLSICSGDGDVLCLSLTPSVSLSLSPCVSNRSESPKSYENTKSNEDI